MRLGCAHLGARGGRHGNEAGRIGPCAAARSGRVQHFLEEFQFAEIRRRGRKLRGWSWRCLEGGGAEPPSGRPASDPGIRKSTEVLTPSRRSIATRRLAGRAGSRRSAFGSRSTPCDGAWNAGTRSMCAGAASPCGRRSRKTLPSTTPWPGSPMMLNRPVVRAALRTTIVSDSRSRARESERLWDRGPTATDLDIVLIPCAGVLSLTGKVARAARAAPLYVRTAYVSIDRGDPIPRSSEAARSHRQAPCRGRRSGIPHRRACSNSRTRPRRAPAREPVPGRTR